MILFVLAQITYNTGQSTGAMEYADSILAKNKDTTTMCPTKKKKRGEPLHRHYSRVHPDK